MRPGSKYWTSVDRYLSTTVFLLIVIGVVAVSSASTVLSFERFGNNNFYFFRQIIFALGGMVIIAIFSRIDYHRWERWSRPILIVSALLLVAVLIPGIGFKPAGARSWIRLGDFLLQPSEFAKIAVVIYLASWFHRKKDPHVNFWFGVVPPLLVVGLVASLVVLEPDIGTAAMIGVITIVMLYAGGVRLRYLFSLLTLGVAGFWVLVKAAPYRAARIITFLDPSLDPLGIGYHINQALLAIGAGGIWGYGLGASRQKHNFLPEPIGDSIFAVLAEELGFLRILIIILLFAAFIFFSLRVASKAPDKFGRYAALGITGWIGLQALINIGSISCLLPFT